MCGGVCVWVTVKGDGTILYLVLQGARIFQNSSKWNLIHAFRCTYNCLKNWVNLVFYDKKKCSVKEPANHTFFPFFYLLPSSWELKSLPSSDNSGMSRNLRWSAISRRCRKLPGKNNEENFRICSWSLDDDFWSKRKDPGNYCSLLDCLGWETHPAVCSP